MVNLTRIYTRTGDGGRTRLGDFSETRKSDCRLRAYADDHTVVGEMTFAPREGGNTVDVRTERLATSVELVGCTAEGQSRPQ